MSSDFNTVKTTHVLLGKICVWTVSHLYYLGDLRNWKGYLEKEQNKFFQKSQDIKQVSLCVCAHLFEMQLRVSLRTCNQVVSSDFRSWRQHHISPWFTGKCLGLQETAVSSWSKDLTNWMWLIPNWYPYSFIHSFMGPSPSFVRNLGLGCVEFATLSSFQFVGKP